MIKLFTDSDLDGLGCGIVAKLAFGDEAEVIYCSYRNLNQRVESFLENQENHDIEVYITDLSVGEAVEKKLEQHFQMGQSIHVIDHHVTALHFNEYKWGHIKVEYESGKKTCATSLFYDYLVEHQLIKGTAALEEFIDLVRQYDTWEWEMNNNVTAKRLNDLFYIMDRETFEDDLLKRIKENPNSFHLTETETMILDLEEQKIERYIHSKNRQLIQADVDEYCVGIIYAEQYLSELGNALNKLNPHLDMIAMMNMSGKKIGFRTIHDEVNVAEYAKRYGGGGHPKASGCELTKELFDKLVVNVFEIPPIKPDPQKNELNVKDADYGTVYQNRRKEFSFITKQPDNTYAVIHNQEKLGETFASFFDAERHIKRKFSSWLCFDDECLRQLGALMSLPTDQVKSNYPRILNDAIEKMKKSK